MCTAVEALNVVFFLSVLQEVRWEGETLVVQDIALINTLSEVTRGIGI